MKKQNFSFMKTHLKISSAKRWPFCPGGDDPDGKVHGANMGPTWVLLSPGGPHVGPINLAIRGVKGSQFWPCCSYASWWRHQMETFSTLLAICAGNSPVPGEFPAQRPVTRSFGVFFDLRLNKPLSKQWWAWWFETLSCPLWRHCNG